MKKPLPPKKPLLNPAFAAAANPRAATSGAPVFSWMGDVLMEGENVMPTGLDNDYIDAYTAARARSIGRGVSGGPGAFIVCARAG